MINIPKQLKNKAFRFNLLLKDSKIPIPTKKWSEVNYKYNEKELLKHPGNYGVIGGYGNLRILDIDNKELAEKLFNVLDTFTVKTCGGTYHFYFISEYNENKVLKDNLGEYRANNYYVVGPGSYAVDIKKNHSGTYEVVKDIKIKKITKEELFKIINLYLKEKELIKDEQTDVDIDFLEKNVLLKLPNLIYSLIKEPRTKEELNGLGFPSRSERDQRVITNLLLNGFGNYIKAIFEKYPIGDKYREHNAKETYLEYSIKGGRKYSGINEDIIPRIETKINETKENIIRNKIDDFLTEISLIKNEFYKKYFLSLIAFKIKISKNDLIEKLKIIESSNKLRANISIKDLIKKDIKKPEYWMFPLIPKDSLIFVAGMPESFKSLFCLSSVLYMQANKPLLDTFETKEVPKVLYYDLENGEKIQYWRIKYLQSGGNLDLSDNFSFYFDFDKNNIKKELELAKNYDIVILDSYRRFLEGEENKSEVVNKFFNDFLFPLREMGKTVLIIHHMRKLDMPKLNASSILNSLRGSGDIGAQPDVVFGLLRHDESINITGDNVSFKVSVLKGKCRNIFPIQNFTFKVDRDDKLEKTNLSFIGYNVSMNPKDTRQQRILDLIEESKTKQLKRIEIVKIVSTEFGCSEIAVDKDLKELADLDKLYINKHGIYSLNYTKENTLDLDTVQEVLK